MVPEIFFSTSPVTLSMQPIFGSYACFTRWASAIPCFLEIIAIPALSYPLFLTSSNPLLKNFSGDTDLLCSTGFWETATATIPQHLALLSPKQSVNRLAEHNAAKAFFSINQMYYVTNLSFPSFYCLKKQQVILILQFVFRDINLSLSQQYLNLFPMGLLLFSVFSTLVLCAVAGYSTSVASELTYLAAITYSKETDISSWNCEYCSKFKILQPKVIQKGSIFGFVGYSPSLNTVVVAFRGSVDAANWITNLETTRTSYPHCTGCTVHVGFNAGYKSVQQEVQKSVKMFLQLYQGVGIMVTGHSLGGALAVLAAADLQLLFKRVESLYTLGQPRVGNDLFAVWMTNLVQNAYRVVNYGDQVPHVPQSILGFKHSGFEVWYYERGMQHYKICVSESKDCSNQLTILTLNQADHKILLYLQLKVESTLTELRNQLLFRVQAWNLLFMNKLKLTKNSI